MPEAPTGINFIGPTDNADVHVLWRALYPNNLDGRAVQPTRLVQAQKGYRELIDYRIKYEIRFKNLQRTTLPLSRPLPRGA